MSWDTLGPVAVSNPVLILLFAFTVLAMFYALSIALDLYTLRRIEKTEEIEEFEDGSD